MKRHDLDLVSLIFGLLFSVAAGWYFVSRYFDLRVDVPNGGWFVAAALIVLGLLGVAASLRYNRDEPHSIDDESNT
jgi:predicted lysophospholipase L1 biosynthesis ABC-type transport system permease subunit